MQAKEKLTAIADAIREKTGGTAALTLDGMAAAIPTVYAEGEAIGFDNGYHSGVADQYNGFWDVFQDNGNRTNYRYGFCGLGWAANTLKPKYVVKPIDSVANNQYGVGMFLCCNYASNKPRIDFATIADKFDFSGLKNAKDTFNSAGMNNITADLSNVETANATFALSWGGGMDNLTVKVTEKLTSVTNMFQYNKGLTTIRFMEGSVIVCDGWNFQWSTALTKQSIENILAVLSDTVSGKTLTLSETAVNNAFTDTEWETLLATKPNWTINLI